MKTIRLQCVFFVGVCFFLTGCPAPNPYGIFAKSDSNKLFSINIISSESYDFNILAVHPFLDTKKKIIIVNGSVNNKSNQNLILDSSSLKLESKEETFSLITTDQKLKNPFKVDSTELTVKPNQAPSLTLYFISKGSYTKKEYKRSLKTDTLVLNIQIFKEKETFYLIQ